MAPLYIHDVDFTALALQDSDFAKHLSSSGHLNFQDPKAVQQLTKSLLKRDFGVRIELPDDRLCPPVPVRYQYVRWIQSLLDCTHPSWIQDYDQDRSVIGLDIGTGASAIYPLLACSLQDNWRMVGTDIDEVSLKHAERNIALNHYEDRIRLLRTGEADNFFSPVLEKLPDTVLDFTMCNPPFYSSQKEMRSSLKGAGKASGPSAVCTGSVNEMVTKGGDAGFVLRMLKDSAGCKNRVRWFSSMFGKLESAKTVITKLKEVLGSDGNWAVTVLPGGNKTRRWVVAWSWQDHRPTDDCTRGEGVAKEFLPVRTQQCLDIGGSPQDDVKNSLCSLFSSLSRPAVFEWREDCVPDSILVSASENVWSRAARRKFAREEDSSTFTEMDMAHDANPFTPAEVAMIVKLTIDSGKLEMRWLKGKQYALVESFWGMLVKKIQAGRQDIVMQ